MIRSFTEYKIRREMREQADPSGQGVGPGLGHVDGQPDHGDDEENQGGGPGEARQAFRDLVPVMERAMTGPSGRSIVNDIVNAIMNNDQVPDALKQELKGKIAGRWSGIIDLNQGDNPGKGQGLGNNSPSNQMGGSSGFGMDNNMQGAVNPKMGQ